MSPLKRLVMDRIACERALGRAKSEYAKALAFAAETGDSAACVLRTATVNVASAESDLRRARAAWEARQ